MQKLINRQEAGILLGDRLLELPLKEPLVLALPRGGVPVGYEISHTLGAQFDILVTRMIGAPRRPELGIGAITEDGFSWLNPHAVDYLGVSQELVQKLMHKERNEVERQVKRYRSGRPLPSIRGRSVIIVDDGLATGVTARVACGFVRMQGAYEIVLAVPVASPRSVEQLRFEVDKFVCLNEPEEFFSVAQFYEDFSPVSDTEVLGLMHGTRLERPKPKHGHYAESRSPSFPADLAQ